MLNSIHGRVPELGTINRCLRQLKAGHGRFVLVEGSAGLGKSRLLHEAARSARQRGIAVASGRSAEHDLQTPLAPLVAALRTSEPPILDEHDLTGLGDMAYQRVWVTEKLPAVIEERSRAGPILIELDDVQWADPVTMLALRSLAPRLAESSVMWLLARRPIPPTPTLDTVIATLSSSHATVTGLAPLQADVVAAMANDVLGGPPDRALSVLIAKCGGNPFLILELLQVLDDEHLIVVDATQARLLTRASPDEFYQRLSAGLGHLSPPTRQMLEVASIFGCTFDIRCVADVQRRTVAELLPSLQEALRTGILVEEGESMAFRYELIRDAAYGALPVTSRRMLHREAATSLVSAGGSSLEAAAHTMRGAVAGDVSAIAILQEASQNSALTTPARAADMQQKALEMMPRGDPRQPRQVAEVVRMLLQAQRCDEAESVASAALEERMPVDVKALIHFQLADALALGGDATRSLHHAHRGLELRDVPESTRSLLLAVAANAHLQSGDVDAARRVGREATHLGEESGAYEAVCRGLLTLSATEQLRGHLDRSLELVDRSLRFDAAGPAGVLRPGALWLRGRTLMAMDRFEDASAAFANARQTPTAVGSSTLGNACAATLLLHQGLLRDAATEAEAGLVSIDESGTGTDASELLATLAQAAVHRGELNEARKILGEAADLGRESLEFGSQQLAWAAALIDEAEDEPSKAIARLAPICNRLPDGLTLLVFDPAIAPRLVALARRTGDEELARVATSAAEHLAELNPGVTSIISAGIQARGLLEGDLGRLVAAADAFESSPRPLARGRAYEDAADALLAAPKKRRAQAVKYLTLALGLYDRLGADARALRLRERLLSLGERGKAVPATRRPALGWSSLTEAELRVARLAAHGLTNRVIADELTLSPHTVESHLRHSFNKLDIRSRVQLTRIVLENEPRLDG